jgi:hypothetical protein
VYRSYSDSNRTLTHPWYIYGGFLVWIIRPMYAVRTLEDERYELYTPPLLFAHINHLIKGTTRRLSNVRTAQDLIPVQ